MRSPGTHLILLLGQLCFASLAVVGRLAVGHVPPAAIVLTRLAGGAAVFAVIAWRRGALRFERRELPFLAGCAALGVVANQELFLHGLARSTAINATVLGATIPVFTSLFAIALRQEPVRPRRLAGIAVAFGGVAVLVGAEELSLSSAHLAGSLMVIANSACYGLYLVIVRRAAARHDPIALLAILFALGVPMAAPLGVRAWLAAPPLDAATVGFLVFLVAVPTVAAYGLVQTALRRAPASLVASYVYLQPVFATLGAVALLGEHPGPRTAVAAAIVLSGVWLAARAR